MPELSNLLEKLIEEKNTNAFLVFDNDAFILKNRREDNSLIACLIDESTIASSILDFSISLQDEGYLYSK